jgi:hypothetical protein
MCILVRAFTKPNQEKHQIQYGYQFHFLFVITDNTWDEVEIVPRILASVCLMILECQKAAIHYRIGNVIQL